MRNKEIVAAQTCYRLPALFLFMLFYSISLTANTADVPDARELVQAAMDHWRGTNPYSEMTMTIHRADWERSMFTQLAWYF